MDIVTIEKMSEADYDFLLAKVKIEKKKNDEAEAKAKADKEAEEKKHQSFLKGGTFLIDNVQPLFKK